MIRFFTTLVLLVTVIATTAHAQKVLTTEGDWTAFQSDDGGVCYMASAPKTAKGNYTKRGDPYLMVVIRKGKRERPEVSIEAGYTYKEGSKVEVSITVADKSQNFKMFTSGSTAWAETWQEDKALAKALQAGSSVTVIGFSTRGTKTTDTYGLKGSTAAYQLINEACR